jgi:hypothetical protein
MCLYHKFYDSKFFSCHFHSKNSVFFGGIVKPWEFCDLALWLCGRIGSGWCQKERLGKSFPTHQRMLDFVEQIKSYDHLKLLV